jgi:hypothetical protein
MKCWTAALPDHPLERTHRTSGHFRIIVQRCSYMCAVLREV